MEEDCNSPFLLPGSLFSCIGDKGTVPMVALTFLLAIYTKLLHRELEAAACSEDSIELLPQKSGTLLGK